MCSYIFNIYIDLCERVSDDAVVSEDVNMNYASDQSCDSNKSVDSSEGEEHWDTDTEEILKDFEKVMMMDYIQNHHWYVVHLISSCFFICVGIILWSLRNSFKPFNWVPSSCIFDCGYQLC